MERRAIITAISLALFMAPAATAAEFESNPDNLTEYKDLVNENFEQLPDFVKNLVGDQNINIYIDRNQSESYNLSLQMNGTQVESINNKSLEQPNIEVWTSTEIIENITESDQPAKQMGSAIDEEKIEYRANDTWTKITLFFAGNLMKLF